jgi:hypothetical protein
MYDKFDNTYQVRRPAWGSRLPWSIPSVLLCDLSSSRLG